METLTYISNLSVPEGYGLEVLIIDNLCSDDTISVVEHVSHKLGISNILRIISEPILGLSFARINGICNSKFDYIIFCDDDNWLFPNYLDLVLENFSNLDVSIVGGMGIAKSDSLLPEWFIKFGGYGYAVGDVGLNDGFGQSVYGAGMALRKRDILKLQEIKNSLLLSDRKGKSLVSGGDSEICVLVGSDRVYFDRRMNFYHYLPSNRLKLDYYLNLNFNFGVSTSRLYFYKLFKYENDFLAFKVFTFSFIKNFKFLLLSSNNSIENKVLRSFHLGLVKGFLINFFFFKSLRKKAKMNLLHFRDS